MEYNILHNLDNLLLLPAIVSTQRTPFAPKQTAHKEQDAFQLDETAGSASVSTI